MTSDNAFPLCLSSSGDFHKRMENKKKREFRFLFHSISSSFSFTRSTHMSVVVKIATGLTLVDKCFLLLFPFPSRSNSISWIRNGIPISSFTFRLSDPFSTHKCVHWNRTCSSFASNSNISQLFQRPLFSFIPSVRHQQKLMFSDSEVEQNEMVFFSLIFRILFPELLGSSYWSGLSVYNKKVQDFFYDSRVGGAGYLKTTREYGCRIPIDIRKLDAGCYFSLSTRDIVFSPLRVVIEVPFSSCLSLSCWDFEFKGGGNKKPVSSKSCQIRMTEKMEGKEDMFCSQGTAAGHSVVSRCSSNAWNKTKETACSCGETLSVLIIIASSFLKSCAFFLL